jgi:2-amino-4-hydroxy-6-hydroxymethyldihydropteridine diphosphokinase
MSEKRVFLSLGTNLGDRRANLERAIKALPAEGVQVLRRSSIYETEPQDFAQQPWFLNMVVECRTRLYPFQLLAAVRRLERQLGRERGPNATPKGPRIIDIDILLYGRARIQTPHLEIPHPRMLDRRFVLEPLCEIDPELRYPNGVLIRERLKLIRDQVVQPHASNSPPIRDA